MSDPVLDVRDLQVRLSSPRGVVHAVRGVSFGVEAGHTHGIVGESGSGKTTLLRAILGLLPSNAVPSGAITVSGHHIPLVGGRTKAVDGVSIVFQEPMTALNPVVRVGLQIAEAPRFKLGLGRKGARERALELMRQVGIPDPARRFDAYPHELSGGLRQRVLIAIALSAKPKIILCDEPTTALDVTVQDQILKLFRRISEETGVAIVYVTHDLAVVAQTCRTVSVMYGGQFLESGTIDEVFGQPRHPYTLGLLGAVPDVSRGRTPLVAIPGSPPDLVSPGEGCPFRPRCSYAQAECADGLFPLRRLHRHQSTACIRHDALSAYAPVPESEAS